jgi:hypothetical protein
MAISTDWTMIAGIWNWLANNQVQVGLCIAILGALFTLSGLLFAGYQIKTGAKALQASTLYQIQKDGRDLRKDALQDPDYVLYVEEYSSGGAYPPDVISKAERRVGIILQFYASIFNQWRFGTLNDATWQVVHSDLCGFVTRKPVQTMWQESLSRTGFSQQFVRAVDRCISNTA